MRTRSKEAQIPNGRPSSSEGGRRDLANFPAIRPKQEDDEGSSGSPVEVRLHEKRRMAEAESVQMHSSPFGLVRLHSSPSKHTASATNASLLATRASASSPTPASNYLAPPSSSATSGTSQGSGSVGGSTKKSITDFFEKVLRDEDEKRALILAQRTKKPDAKVESVEVSRPSKVSKCQA